MMTANRCFLVGLLFLLACDGSGSKKSTARVDPAKGKDIQKSIIDELIKKGLVSQLDSSSKPPRLYVTQDFQKDPREVKEGLLRIVFDYCYDKNEATEEVRVLAVHDSQSGKKLGEYGREGLKSE